MPYIDQAARAEIAAGRAPNTVGELVFFITRLAVNHLAENGPLTFDACFRVVRDLTTLQHEIVIANTGEQVLQVPVSALCQKVAEALGVYKLDHPETGPNDALGVLECVKLEFYRRVVAPYEDKKCAENGDAYHPFYGVL